MRGTFLANSLYPNPFPDGEGTSRTGPGASSRSKTSFTAKATLEPEIGEIIAQSVFDYLHSDYGRKTIDDLASLGVTWSRPPRGRSRECWKARRWW